MAKITKDTLIVDCLKLNPNSAEILQSVGMHCIGCAMAHGESNKLSGKRRCAAFRFFQVGICTRRNSLKNSGV